MPPQAPYIAHRAPQAGPDPKVVARGRTQYAAEVERHMATDWAGLPAEAVTKRQAALKYTLVTEPALKTMGPPIFEVRPPPPRTSSVASH